MNAKGEIIGVNTRGLSRGRAVTVPVATVDRVVSKLLEKGNIARPYLGIAMQPVALPESVRSQLPADARMGLVIMHVESGGPAEKAGVLLGDVVVEVAGKPVEDTEAIQDLISTAKVGDTVAARLLRAGQIKPVSITLGEKAR